MFAYKMTARDRGSGWIDQAAVEGLDGEHRVGGDRGSGEVRVVGQHLLGIRNGTLIARVREVGQEVVECRADRSDEVGPEPGSDCVRRRCGAADIIVEQHERDVVPVLGEPTAARRCQLGEEEPGKAADVHLDGEQVAADPGGQLRSEAARAARDRLASATFHDLPEMLCRLFAPDARDAEIGVHPRPRRDAQAQLGSAETAGDGRREWAQHNAAPVDRPQAGPLGERVEGRRGRSVDEDVEPGDLGEIRTEHRSGRGPVAAQATPSASHPLPRRASSSMRSRPAMPTRSDSAGVRVTAASA